MGLPWFRMYVDFAKDPKIQTMDETFQRRFVMLLCLRCNDELKKLSDEELAFALHVTLDDLISTKEVFIKKGFIDKKWNILNWDKRQFKSDNSTERSRRYREKQKKGRSGNGNATLRQRDGNVNITVPDTDTDTDTEKEEETKHASGVPSLFVFDKPGSIPKELSNMSGRFPPWDFVEYVQGSRFCWNNDKIISEFEKFVAYWEENSHKKSTWKKNWLKTWQNWALNQRKWELERQERENKNSGPRLKRSDLIPIKPKTEKEKMEEQLVRLKQGLKYGILGSKMMPPGKKERMAKEFRESIRKLEEQIKNAKD